MFNRTFYVLVRSEIEIKCHHRRTPMHPSLKKDETNEGSLSIEYDKYLLIPFDR